MKLKFSRQIFERSLNMKLHQNPSSGGGGGVELFHADGQTGGHDDAIVALRNFANAP
jgi:hypothetical protein